jgi:hypothetical protein
MPVYKSNANTITVQDETTDTTCYPTFVTTATGFLGQKTNAGLTYNANTDVFHATTVSTDTVSEFNSANGVTVDGCKLKDNLVVGGSGTGVANSSLDTTAGEPGGAWKSWTPTFVNLSGGTLNYAVYTKIGKTVHFSWKYTLAGAGVAGSVTFTTPTTMNISASSDTMVNSTRFVRSASYVGEIRPASSTVCTVLVRTASGNYVGLAVLSSTVPDTWANGDTLSASGTYQEA